MGLVRDIYILDYGSWLIKGCEFCCWIYVFVGVFYYDENDDKKIFVFKQNENILNLMVKKI